MSNNPEKTPEPIFHPIDRLPAIAEMTAVELLNAKDLYQALDQARGCPHLLGGTEIERVIRLCKSQLEMVPVCREQAARWRVETLSTAHRKALDRLDADIEEFDKVVHATLALAKEMASGTIDAILRTDDGELGMAMLEGRRPPPSGPPLSEAWRVKEYRAIAVMLDAVGATLPPRADPLESLAAVAPQMALFHRLLELCDGTELNALCSEFGGLYRFARTMELIAAGIRAGTIS